MPTKYLLLSITVLFLAATACHKSEVRTLMQDHTHKMAGTWNFKKYEYPGGNKQYVKDTSFSIEVINDTALRLAGKPLPLVRDRMTFPNHDNYLVATANPYEYLLFGGGDSIVTVVKYYYPGNTVSVESAPYRTPGRVLYESTGKQ